MLFMHCLHGYQSRGLCDFNVSSKDSSDSPLVRHLLTFRLPTFQHLLDLLIFTARKQSLGQGNIFTPVCHSVHRGGAWAGTPSSRYIPPGAGTPTLPPPPSRYTPGSSACWEMQAHNQAVHILLECILVLSIYGT